jgi:DNA ligase D
MKSTVLELAGHEVTITNPTKIFWPKLGLTKLDLVNYYVSVAEGAIRGVYGRPMLLKRFPNGVEQEAFFQKRAPVKRPDWIEVATFTFPSGRHADEVVVRNAAQLAWVINLGCIDLNAHPVRKEDMDHPDELRVDLDPVPGVPWSQIVDVALVAKETLEDFGLVGWPKTSGSRGIHIWVRIEPRWPFHVVRRAALAFAREVERRMPDDVTTTWWRKDRDPADLFVDYNQNARDHTIAAAYSVRGNPMGTVSTPVQWEGVADVQPDDFTIATVPPRYAELGDLHAGIDDAVFDLAPLVEWAERDEREGKEGPADPED